MISLDIFDNSNDSHGNEYEMDTYSQHSQLFAHPSTTEGIRQKIPNDEFEIELIKKDNAKVRLEWRGLNVNAILPQPGCCAKLRKGYRKGDAASQPKTLPILKDVNGVAEPGSLVAIMGASGAGKTTMLNVLSRHNRAGLEINGSILVNNKNIASKIKSISAYVQQQDLFVGTLTVREHLLFQAILRMDAKYTTKEKRQRVNDVLAQLSLLKCQHTIIGVPGRIRGISGGEQKRLSFASEIITNPKLLFVDEPTSGLDSFMAESCIVDLQKLASEGRTIIATIHQPSSRVFQLFDRLIILSEGRTAFHGSTKDAVDFFNECGYPSPLNFNPADHYIRTLAVIPGNEEECRRRAGVICDAYEASRFAMVNCSSVENEENQLQVSTKSSYQQGFITQVREVLWRSTKQFQRDPIVSKIRVIQSIFLSLVIGLIFLKQPNNQNGVANINGLLFLLISLSFSTATSILMIFPSELPVFLKENKLGMYRVDAYFIGRQMAEVPWYFITTSIEATMLYWMTGLPAEFPKFVTFFGICHMNTQCALSYGMIIAAAAPTTAIALALAGPCILPLLLFGGFFIKEGSIPVYFVWLKVFSWMRYSFELAQINQWDGFGDIGCSNTTEACLPDGQTVLKMNGYNPDNFNATAGCLLALIVCFRLIAFILIVIRTYRTK